MPRPSRFDLAIIDPVDQAVATMADPTRWRILNLLAAEGERTATMLAERLPVTRPGIAKHLGILVAAGLLRVRRRGREVLYRVRPGRLAESGRWLARIEHDWTALGDALAEPAGRD